MKLINNGPSPFGRKVMIALREKGIPFELEWDIPWHEDTTVPQYNPLEQLPILVSDSGEFVYESSHILAWLEWRYPTPPLVPADPAAVIRMRLFQVLSVGVMDAIVRINFELARPPAHHSSAWLARQKRKLVGGTREIARLLGDGEFAVGGSLSHADLEIGSVYGHLDFLTRSIPELGQIFENDLPWRRSYPNLSRYIDRLEERPSFKAAPPFMVEIRFQSVVA